MTKHLVRLFLLVAAVFVFTCAYAQISTRMMLGQPPAILRVASVAPVSTAYYLSGINAVGIAKNNLATSGGVQYLCYYNTANPPAPKFLLRTLTTNAVTFVDPGLPAQGLTPTDDEHGNCSIAIDTGGFMHVSYGQHGSAVGLNYYKSNNPVTTTTVGGPFTKLSMVAGNSTIESSVTYPFFIKNPTTGELYFSFRNLGSGDGNQYFYHYTTGTTTWSAAAGTGTGGLLINDHANTTVTSPYLNGLPKWDAAGNLWFNWQEWDAVAGAAHSQYLVAWTGTAFQDITGAAVTMPIVTQSFTPALVIPASANANPQNDFTLNKGVFYIPYLRQDGSGIYQVYVAESSSGTFVEHQLTSNTSNQTGCGTPANMQCVFGPAAIGNSDGSVYVVYPDIFSAPPGQGVVAAKSSNSFASFTNQVLFSTYTPNFGLNADPTRIGSIASFMRMDAADYQFGFWSGSTPAYTFSNQGSMVIYDWALAYTPGTPPNFGGGGGGLPSQVIASGLTTPIFSADFTQSSFSNIATWLDGCGGPTSGLRFVWRWWANNGTPPCGPPNGIFMDTDGGVQVVHMHFPASFNATGGGHPNPNIFTLEYPGVPFASVGSPGFPSEFYEEYTFRTTANTLNQGSMNNVLTAWMAPGGGLTCIIAQDFMEVVSNTNTGNGWSWADFGTESCGGGAAQPTTFSDFTTYHVMGALYTSDGTHYAKCSFLDRQKLWCGSYTLADVTTLNDHARTLIAGMGSDSNNVNNGSIINDEDLFIKSYNIWACPNSFATQTQCIGPLITN